DHGEIGHVAALRRGDLHRAVAGADAKGAPAGAGRRAAGDEEGGTDGADADRLPPATDIAAIARAERHIAVDGVDARAEDDAARRRDIALDVVLVGGADAQATAAAAGRVQIAGQAEAVRAVMMVP